MQDEGGVVSGPQLPELPLDGELDRLACEWQTFEKAEMRLVLGGGRHFDPLGYARNSTSGPFPSTWVPAVLASSPGTSSSRPMAAR